MQITPVLLDKTKTVDYLTHVLNRIEPMFGFNLSSICERHGNCLQGISQEVLAVFSIRELKSLADSLVFWFEVSSFPKRNSKISLSRWLAEIFLYIQQAIHEPIGGVLPAVVAAGDDSLAAESVADQIEVACPACGFVHEPGKNTLCDYANPGSEIEVLQPEVYTISIIDGDYSFSEERVSRLPPYLVDRKGRLLKKFWHRNYDAGYAQIVSEHLSNIVVGSGLVIKLMAENLEVFQTCIVGDPPPFLIHRGGVYKRDRVKFGLAVRYAQVVSEHLSNIAVV